MKEPETIEDLVDGECDCNPYNHHSCRYCEEIALATKAHALGMKEEAAKTALLPPSYDKVVERDADGNETIRPAERVICELRDKNEKLQSRIKELEAERKEEINALENGTCPKCRKAYLSLVCPICSTTKKFGEMIKLDKENTKLKERIKELESENSELLNIIETAETELQDLIKLYEVDDKFVINQHPNVKDKLKARMDTLKRIKAKLSKKVKE